MPTLWKKYTFGLVAFLGCTPALFAQLGGAGPVAPIAGPVVAPAAAPAPAPANLWSFLCPSAEQKAACREKLCRSAIGKIASGMLQPISAFSGGLITDRCALPTAKDLAKPAESADGAAAMIKKDELEAKERRAAVRYLGTVECNRWPEAEAALINALRGDRNECVRLEAAWVLGRGCCCTPRIVKALSLTVSGSDVDGFPVERSERVRAAASGSLNHCLACLAPQIPVSMGAPIQEKTNGGEKGKELPPLPGGKEQAPPPQILAPTAHTASGSGDASKAVTPEVKRALYYSKVEYKDIAPLVQKAKALSQTEASSSPAGASARNGGLLGIVGTAFNPANGIQGREVIQVSGMEPPQSYGAVSPAVSPYHTGAVSVEAPAPAPGGRGLLPTLWNMNPLRRTISTSTEMAPSGVIQAEPVPSNVITLPAHGSSTQYAPSTQEYVAPNTGGPGSAIPSGPVHIPVRGVTPRTIDEILANPSGGAH